MNEDSKLNVGIVFQDSELCQNISDLLKQQYHVSIFGSISDLLNKLIPQPPKIVLCERSLIVGKEQEILSNINRRFPESQSLIIGPNLSIEEQVLLLRNGARGYFDQALLKEKLLFALTSLQNGEVWVERHVISGLIDSLAQLPTITEEQKLKLDSLSPKEMEVATLVSKGATNKLIARNMNITERTVKSHLTTIFQKMEMTDRLSLAIFFRDIR